VKITTYLKPLSALILLAGLIPVAFAADDAKPSATVVIDETQVMLIVGGSSGKGTLVPHFSSETRSFTVGGIKLGGIGIHKTHLSGDVYHLSKVQDFEGTYFSAEAGVTVGKGVGGLWLKNDKGVTMHLTSRAEGIALALGVEGLTVKFKN